jgi:hypothetical protein
VTTGTAINDADAMSVADKPTSNLRKITFPTQPTTRAVDLDRWRH